jgi:hypothetical protein
MSRPVPKLLITPKFPAPKVVPRIPEIGAIERVEELRPKLQALSLRNGKLLVERKVEIRLSGPIDNVDARIPIAIQRSPLEDVGVRPFLDCCCPARVRLVVGITDHVGP